MASSRLEFAFSPLYVGGALQLCELDVTNLPLRSSDTEPEERVFNVLLGAFLNDVVLKNITFSTGVLTVEECKAAGFLIREHGYPNGTKGFSIQVPFDDDVVLKHVCEVALMAYQVSLSWLSGSLFLSPTSAESSTLGHSIHSSPGLRLPHHA